MMRRTRTSNPITPMTDDEPYDFERIVAGAGDDRPTRGTRDVVTLVHLSATFELDETGYPDAGHTSR